MKTSSISAASLIACVALFAFDTPAQAQNNAREAADTLRALNIQIGEAQRDGNRRRVHQLQDRFMQVQREWGVRPSPGPAHYKHKHKHRSWRR